MTAPEIELAIAEWFNPRQNIIVPNVSWGMFAHECDLLVLTKSGYAYEVEIKVNKYDLIRDKFKKHGHKTSITKRLYFAIPEALKTEISHIPEYAGIIIVKQEGYAKRGWFPSRIEVLREPIEQNARKFTEAEKFNLARLGTMRIWTLKKKLKEVQNGND